MIIPIILDVASNEVCLETIKVSTSGVVSEALKYLNIIVPSLALVLVVLDLLIAVIQGDQKAMNEKMSRSVKRLALAALFLLLPTLFVGLGKIVFDMDMFEDKEICAVKVPLDTIVDYGHQIREEQQQEGEADTSFCVPGEVTEGPGGEYYAKQICANNRVYKIYKQQWYGNTQFFGNQNMSSHGCSVTTLAIIMSGFDASIEPLQLRKHFTAKNWTSIGNAAYNEGFAFQRVARTPSAIRSTLASGIPIITLIYYPGGGGHYVSLLGERSDGTLIIGNSSVGGLEKTTVEAFLKNHTLSLMYKVYK